MKKNNVVVLTTAFSQQKSFSEDYFNSLAAQTDKAFDILLIDDGCDDLASFQKQFPALNILIVPGAGNIAKNRELLINEAIDRGYQKAIFADFDDYFSSNRIAVSVQLLAVSSVVMNELKLVDADRRPLGDQFGVFLKDQQTLGLADILEANCFGMSNTAIDLTSVPRVHFDKLTKVVDWHFFSSLLLSGEKAVYTNQCWTFYRQHDRSMAHIRCASKEQLRNELLVKKHHYSLMLFHAPVFASLLTAVNEVLTDDVALEKYFEQNSKKTSPFWWSLFNTQVYRKANI